MLLPPSFLETEILKSDTTPLDVIEVSRNFQVVLFGQSILGMFAKYFFTQGH